MMNVTFAIDDDSALMKQAREHEKRVLEPFGLARADELKNVLRQLIDLHQRPELEIVEQRAA